MASVRQLRSQIKQAGGRGGVLARLLANAGEKAPAVMSHAKGLAGSAIPAGEQAGLLRSFGHEHGIPLHRIPDGKPPVGPRLNIPVQKPTAMSRIGDWISQNPRSTIGAGAAAATLPFVAGHSNSPAPAASTPAVASEAAPAPAPTAAEPTAAEPVATAGLGEMIPDHLKNYWPAYAAGGIGLAAIQQLRKNLHKREQAAMHPLLKEAQVRQFVQSHPVLAGFLCRCAHEQLSENAIRVKLATAVALEPSLEDELASAFGAGFLKESLGLGDIWEGTKGFVRGLGQGARNVGNLASGAANTVGGAIGSGVAGVGQLGARATDAVGLTDNAASIADAAAKPFNQALGAGAQQVGQSLGGEQVMQGRAATGNELPVQQMRGGHLRDLHNAGAPNAAGAYNLLSNTSDTAATMAATGMAGGAIPGAGTATQGLQTMEAYSGTPGEALASSSAAVDSGQPGDLLTKMPSYVDGATHPDKATEALLGTQVRLHDGRVVDESQLNQQTMQGPPPDAKPVGALDQELATTTGTNSEAPQTAAPEGATPTAQPATQDPGADHEALAADPNVPPEQKQQVATDAVNQAFEQFALQHEMSPEQAKAFAARAVQEGLTPEESEMGLQRFGQEVMQQHPEAQQDPGFMQQITQSWEGMDNGSKFLLFAGLGLGTISLINALTDPDAGIGSWLLALLGFGGAAGAAGASGMLGQGAQGLLGGVGQQIAGWLGGGQQPQQAAQPGQQPPQTPGLVRGAPPKTPEQAITEGAGNPNIPNSVRPYLADNKIDANEFKQLGKDPAALQGFNRMSDDDLVNVLRSSAQADPQVKSQLDQTQSLLATPQMISSRAGVPTDFAARLKQLYARVGG